MINRNFVLGAASLLAASQAEAAVPTLDTPPLSVQFSTTYYSNIASSSAALAAARGLQRDDILYAPAVLANLVEPMGGISFFLAGQAGYDIHQRNSILDRERIDLQAGADTYVSVCDTTLIGTWGRHQSDLMDLSIGTTKNTQQTISAGLDVSCDRMGRIVPSAGVSQILVRQQRAAIFRPGLSQFFQPMWALAIIIEPIGLISLFGQYARSPPIRIACSSRQAGRSPTVIIFMPAACAISRTIQDEINIAAYLSETSLTPDGGLGQGFSGLTYGLNVGYTPSARWDFDLDFDRTATPSFYQNASFAVSEHYSGSVGYRFTSRLRATSGGVRYPYQIQWCGIDTGNQHHRSNLLVLLWFCGV